MAEPCMSMTGYGHGEVSSSSLRVTVELRSVNHRFLDLQIKLPRAWASLEPQVSKLLRGRLQRGRIEVFVKRETLADAAASGVRVDRLLAAELHEQSRALASELGMDGALTLGELMRLPGVLEVRERPVPVPVEEPFLRDALNQAVEALTQMRAAEGGRLREDLLQRLDHVSGLVEEIRALAKGQAEVIQARLESRVIELMRDKPPEENRLLQEVALLVDRASVDEELTRLDSHVLQAREFLEQGSAVGRQLNFLVQEMNREANTCGSKSGIEQISRAVVELKSEIENIREQVANLE